MTRYLPDVDQLILDVIRSTLTGQQVGNLIPSDLSTRLPYVTARRTSGPTVHARFGLDSTVDVQTWADERKDSADLAENVRIAIYEAWRTQQTYPSGWISFQRCTSAPAELRTGGADAPQDLYRFQATYRLVARK